MKTQIRNAFNTTGVNVSAKTFLKSKLFDPFEHQAE